MSIESDTVQPDNNSSSPAEWSIFKRLKESSHPFAVLSFIFFKSATIAVYLFGSWFTKNAVLIFILLSLLLAADFWNTKNISGRLLVGLRWWNETAEDGSSVWVFETANAERYINPIDSKLFWLFLYAVPIVWVVFGIISILKLNVLWFIAVALALVLTLTNTFAFSRCDKFSKANGIFDSVSSGVFSRMFSFASSKVFNR